MYKVGDKVKFYLDMTRGDPVEGEIIGAFKERNTYTIMYEGSRFCVHEKFIVAKIVDDKLMIQALREKIDILMRSIEWRQGIIDAQRKELVECQKIIEEQRNKIMHCNAKELFNLTKERGYYYINTRR
jgi:hypothetical protein